MPVRELGHFTVNRFFGTGKTPLGWLHARGWAGSRSRLTRSARSHRVHADALVWFSNLAAIANPPNGRGISRHWHVIHALQKPSPRGIYKYPALLKTPPLGCPAQNGVRDDTFGRRRTRGTVPATTHERVHSHSPRRPSFDRRSTQRLQGGPF